MINTTEIRIGNFIIEEDGCMAKVIGFSPFDHSVRCDGDEGCEILVDVYRADGTVVSGAQSDSKKSNPIPLTPEVLVKCGFDHKEMSDLCPFMYMTLSDDISLTWDGACIFIDEFDTPATTLHQLMNLYHALTGEELNYKP